MSTTEERETKKKRAAELKAAFEAKLAPERERRNQEAEEAVQDALISVNGDHTKLIVHRLPDDFGGAVVHWVPTEEYWAAYQRRNLAHEKHGGLPKVVAGMVENPKLIVHPKLPELQTWKDTYPGLYTSLGVTITQAVEGGEAGKA